MDERTAESYRTNAQTFAQKFQGLLDLQRRTEFSLFESTLASGHILDVGCGAGRHTRYFMEQGYRVTAIDVSPAMASLAKSAGVPVVLMDMRALGFSDSSFDGVWSVTSLLHIPKSEVSIVRDEFCRVLRPGGLLYVCVKEGEGQRWVPDTCNPNTSRFFAYWKDEELRDCFDPQFDLLKSWTDSVGKTQYVQQLWRKPGASSGQNP